MLELRNSGRVENCGFIPTIFFKEVARGGERTRVLSISFIFSAFTTLPLSHSGSPVANAFCLATRVVLLFDVEVQNVERKNVEKSKMSIYLTPPESPMHGLGAHRKGMAPTAGDWL
jgi:hypothetical protein